MLSFSDLLLLISLPQHKTVISNMIDMPMQFVRLIIEDLKFAIFDRIIRHPSTSKVISTVSRPLHDFRRNALRESDYPLNSFPLIFGLI